VGSPFLITEALDPRRIDFLDVLRGIAIYGILLVNVFSFGADIPAWTGLADQAAWLLKHLFFETKFWTVFSLLFGMGFYLQTRSPSYRTLSTLRRLGALMLFGCAHALLFEGDILMLYAQLGVFLLLLHRLPTGPLLVLGVLLCLSFPLGHLLGGDRGDDWPPEDSAEAAEWLAEERLTSPLATGGLAEVMEYHAEFIPEKFWIDWQYPDSGLMVLACLLLGFVIMRDSGQRLQHMTQAQAGRLSLGLWLLGAALMTIERYWAVTIGYRPFDRTDALPQQILLADCTYLAATIGLTGAWFFSVRWWVGSGMLTNLRTRIANVGRMSLTSYIAQTLIFTTVFYGYGLGGAFTWGPATVVCLATAIYLILLICCSLWLARFRLGPLEWLWRSITYWRWEPLRRGS
jgi:uncharacterized protein